MTTIARARRGGARTWIYLIACQVGWFACVLSAAAGHAEVGMAFALAVAGIHIWCARRPASEMRLVAVVTALGWIWDSAVARSGLLIYPNGVWIAGTAPYWMAGLWMLFAVQLNTLFRWLRSRTLTAIVFGAAGGPLAYRAGAALHAVQFSHTATAMVTLAAGWAVLFPSFVTLAARWDGMTSPH